MCRESWLWLPPPSARMFFASFVLDLYSSIFSCRCLKSLPSMRSSPLEELPEARTAATIGDFLQLKDDHQHPANSVHQRQQQDDQLSSSFFNAEQGPPESGFWNSPSPSELMLSGGPSSSFCWNNCHGITTFRTKEAATKSLDLYVDEEREM